MNIAKLKKRLVKEELRRRYPNRVRNHWVTAVTLVSLLVGGASLYYVKRDDLLQRRFDGAMEMVREGAFEAAAESFRAVSDSRPDSPLAPQALFQSGEILNLTLKRYSEALIAYLRLLKEYPQSPLVPRSQERVAEIYKYRLLDNGLAIVAYQSLLDMGTQDGARFQYEIADSYFKLNNFEQARIEFESFLKDYPEAEMQAEVTYRIGVCQSLENKLEDAEATLRKVMETWPESPYGIEARFALAEVLEEQERLTEALQVFEALQGRYPSPEALEKKISQVRDRIKKKKKAI